jgi:hypothetical protein
MSGSGTDKDALYLRQFNRVVIRTLAPVAMEESHRRSIKLDEENSHLTLDALRPLEQVPPSRRQLQSVSVPGSWDGPDLTQTGCEPVRMNGLPQALWEPVRPMQRTSATQAFPDVVVCAALGLAQFGLQLPERWAAVRTPEWIAAFLGSFASLVLCLAFLTVNTERRAGLAPPSICLCMRRSWR